MYGFVVSGSLCGLQTSVETEMDGRAVKSDVKAKLCVENKEEWRRV